MTTYGLIKCMEVPPWLEKHGSTEKIYSDFLRLGNPRVDIRVYDAEKGELPAKFTECDIYVITGSPKSAYEKFDWIAGLSKWIKKAHSVGYPIVGICFGHQIIMQALGGKVEKSSKGWGIGIHAYEWEAKGTSRSWFKPKIEAAAVASHQDVVTKLPAEAEVLAGSSFNPYGIVAIDDYIWTIQTHPETTVEYARDLYKMRKDFFTPALLKEADSSFSRAPDSMVVSLWIANFAKYHVKKRRGPGWVMLGLAASAGVAAAWWSVSEATLLGAVAIAGYVAG
ncbi:hypothetical protein AAMO2058_000658500 [Amorphochlora amoebiformis]